ncbi:unnamed protein product [Didymodactylos carnosus]|uniref:Helitron helicase-like domain-containing protein n=1 Tax=Didymodactylos carnosus TaxID=1234261 RepID=A0A815JLJ2_9BILA|nr:unnamed protein product [Didymodactylos carnosus]CAF4276664.1 unnamed protein product [Didymodactylos carnosus]
MRICPPVFVGSNPPNRKQLEEVLIVRKQRVAAALNWLRQNNSLYQHVDIDMNKINELPQSDISAAIWEMMDIQSSPDTRRSGYVNDPLATDQTPLEQNDSIPLVTSGVVDINGTNVTPEDVKEYIMKNMFKEDKITFLPTSNPKKYVIPRSSKPTNEYFNPNLLLGLFPTLFPYGCGAIEDLSRPIKVAFRKHIHDPRINTLLKGIKTVGGHVHGSCQSRAALRTQIHALIYKKGLPSIFMTVNPADTYHPLAMYFAGVNMDLDKLVADDYPTAYQRAEKVARHPVAMAKFFNVIITNLLETIIGGGVLGPVKAHFGTVESQERGTLHFHVLIWLKHDLTPAQMTENIQNEEFRTNLIEYLEDIIKEDVDNFRATSRNEDSSEGEYETSMETDDEVQTGCRTPPAVQYDWNSCYIPLTPVDLSKYGLSTPRTSTVEDAKALVYYITDYITKSSLSFYDTLHLIQKGAKSLKTNIPNGVIEQAYRLILRCYNTIGSQCALSGAQVASYLMNWPDHYTGDKFENLFLIGIERYLQSCLDHNREKEMHVSGSPFEIHEMDKERGTDSIDYEENKNEEGFLVQKSTNDNYVLVNTRIDYECRPTEMETDCLYAFVNKYQKNRKCKTEKEFDSQTATQVNL